MIGFWANAAEKMLGGYSGTPPFQHDPVTAARSMGINVHYVNGPLMESDVDTSAAVRAARDSDVVLYFGGIDNTVEREGQDRTSIAWPPGQLTMIQRLAEVGKPVVVVRMGTHVDDAPLLSMPNVKAILWVGYPGQDGGTAVMNIITGRASPAGRLPMTVYPASYVDQAPFTNMALRNSSSFPGRTYRWFHDSVFPFGYGLHYTKWGLGSNGSFPRLYAIQDLVASCVGKAARLDLCPFTSYPLKVYNTGSRASDFVALGFIEGRQGPRPHAIKTLVAYARAHNIAPGESRDVELKLTLGSLARVDENGNRVLYPGSYDLTVDEPSFLGAQFVITGEEPVVLEEWPQPPASLVD
ncbi:hypothetical protein VTK26DRAFT_6298 [Humicola hyalothermophila]